MAITNGWGQAAVNNTIGYGQGGKNSATGWGETYADSWAGDTDVIGVSADFSYPTSSYAQDGVNPTPTITGASGGTFSATPAGLTLNSSTGEITLSSSTIASYIITYTVSGVSSNVSMGITAASFSNVYSMLFDGTNDVINAGNSINITSDFSYSFWYRSEANSYGAYEFLLSRENTAASIKQFNIYNVFASSGRVLAHIYDSGGTYYRCDTGSGIAENVWHHIAFCYSPSNYIRLYLDGVLEDENTSSIPASIRNVVGEDLRIGGRGNGSMYLDGNMDEVAIWDSTLTATHVGEIYNSGEPNNLDSLATAPAPLYWNRMGD
jgi:hypothetical protein